VVKHDGVYDSTAYEEGDLRIVLYRSRDGVRWTAGKQIYGVSADTPLEAELAFSPSGKRMLALIRLDGNNFDLFGYQGRLRTKVCWSKPPFKRFTCPETLHGVRLDGSCPVRPGSVPVADQRNGADARCVAAQPAR
jgi:hypothetical protein